MCMKKPETIAPSLLAPLTKKEQMVLSYIESQLREHGVSPSYQEICSHFGFASFNSVQNYLKQLTAKGYVQILPNQKRGIQVLRSVQDFQNDLTQRLDNHSNDTRSKTSDDFIDIPFLGQVAAGVPLERQYQNEFVQIPASLLKSTPSSNFFALRVSGDSMIEEGIFDGDLLVIKSQPSAGNGDLVVATVSTDPEEGSSQEATVKRFFNKKSQIELRPANPRLTSIFYSPDQVEVRGIVKALWRQYS